MALHAGCPWCTTPVTRTDEGRWACPTHGRVTPLWRPQEAAYDALVAHLERAGSFPTYLPWPLGPGWWVSDFAVVGDGEAHATMACVSGSSALDGPVDVMVISEEPTGGLAARVIGLAEGESTDFRAAVVTEPAEVKVRVGSHAVGLWPYPVGDAHQEQDRTVLLGEAEGRWLWLVLRPASALLLLRDEWILRDVSSAGPQLVELPFGGPAGAW
ncbi:hypothetical protein KUV85_08990 [Nocardioides panacisoli]|uniref:DUF6758 family protein n=1 Tax=Nocardioides panacisoli TaxID=627624 RepID=UPI001C62FEBF|nr:DUF6758 family protein [Nocardioides panacisoli]QYJ02475.1 hypothetical protein KUV85_08990 [Nocardioides panacisoli]